MLVNRYSFLCPHCGKDFNQALHEKPIFDRNIAKIFHGNGIVLKHIDDIICPKCKIDIEEYLYEIYVILPIHKI